MSTVLRFISLVLIVIALMLLGADLITTLERGGQIAVRSLDQVWAILAPDSLNAFKSWIQHTLPSPLPGWTYSMMALPAWGITGVLGVILAFLFGRKPAEE